MGQNTGLSHISAQAFLPEAKAVAALLPGVAAFSALEGDIRNQAQALVEAIRRAPADNPMEAFLQTYRLDTREGLALMCLAEALLRIPDPHTADQLIHDTIRGKDWRRAIEGNESLFVSASSWGLLFTGRFIEMGDSAGHTLHELAERIGEPLIREALRHAMRIIGAQFVLGEALKDALKNSAPALEKGYRFSYDILGEGARSAAQAERYLRSYRKAILQLGGHAQEGALFASPGISVKLSALHPRYSLSQHERVMAELLPRVKELLLLARDNHITVSIDAEEANRLDIELALFTQLAQDPDLAGWNGLGFVLQAYQKRAWHVIDYLRELAAAGGRVIPLRLVKGAYWDSEIKHAQQHGLPDYPVFTRKEHTDISYLACAEKIISNMEHFYPQFATHNARSAASIIALMNQRGIAKARFEFQRLHGMGEKLHDLLRQQGYSSRIYAPIGEHKDLLAYLIRRLLENGANSSFVNLLMSEDTSLDELLADPVTAAKPYKGAPGIPLPAALYSDRANSRGIDPGYVCMRAEIEQKLDEAGENLSLAEVPATDPSSLTLAIGNAAKAFTDWAALPAQERCAIINRAADLLEEHAHELLWLLVHEAKKTIPDAWAEIREAADFCRYYALHARRLMQSPQALESPTGEDNQLFLVPRGVFACISPWNFPLAIFTGQVVAALVTGNCVIAKPAEQTPRIAELAVRLLHQAGVPREALALAIGKGSVLGARLTSDPRIAGVVFTGSTDTAKSIHQNLAARAGAIPVLVAETGGINCMVVDSSALLEQATDDILLSAFGSAGQRCSALRVLYVQEEIADALLELLSGAMQELSLGNAARFATDIGEVIDAHAKQALEAHILHMKHTCRLVAAAPPARDCGHFVTPHLFEIGTIQQLGKEVFGSVLHVIRFRAKDMQRVASDINSTGYGLTFGMHSRIREHIDFFVSRVRAGNHYINRSMTGAVVGVQPFGGEGLSGTGPKAGGPYYLLRFLQERTVTVNSAAIGGNVALLTAKP